jgi:hypothetical protein
MLKNLLASKKWVTAAISMFVILLNEVFRKVGLDVALDIESVLIVVMPLVAYIVGQGLADMGKEESKMLIENSKEENDG